MRKRPIVFLSLFVAAGLLLSGCSGDDARTSAVPVQSVSILSGLASDAKDRYGGKVVTQQTQGIQKDDNRTVKEIYVEAGEEVKAGQVLFSYDVEEAQLNLEQAKLELEQLKNTVEQLKSSVEQLKKDKEKAPSSEQLSYSIQIQSDELDIRQNEYNITTKEVEIERLEKAMENCDVKSEIDGIVESINDGTQDQFGSGESQDFMKIIQIGDYRIEGKVSEANASSLPVGSPVLIRSRNDESLTWSGILDSIDTDSQAQQENGNSYFDGGGSDTATRYPFYVTLDNSEGLMLGQHVYIELANGDAAGREGVWLPEGFLVYDGETAFVWAADASGKLEKRTVETGRTDEMTGDIEIVSGLTAEDYIAEPSDSLNAGDAVRYFDAGYFRKEEAVPDELEGFAEEGAVDGEEGFDGEGFDGGDWMEEDNSGRADDEKDMENAADALMAMPEPDAED